jgi:hypothetical protein
VQHAQDAERGLTCLRAVLWYGACPKRPVRLVIVRDPNGIEPDDFFFSTDPAAIGAEIASRYAGRWSIEVTFRDTKQDLGGENPQSWKRQGPERAACLALWLHGLTWCWYLGQHPRGDTWIPRPWYPRKASPSFLDALAALRRLLWSQRITALSAAATTAHDKTKITEALLDTLAYAAWSCESPRILIPFIVRWGSGRMKRSAAGNALKPF